MERAKGFFTDTTVCIGCKACEVACKQWNQLPDDGFIHRHVLRQHRRPRRIHLASRGIHRAPSGARRQDAGAFSWLIMSDVCKHCARAGCLEACPTGAIIRTEFDSVYVQPDVCNGCGYCVAAARSASSTARAGRRTAPGNALSATIACKHGHEPACAKACPTDSIHVRRARASCAKRRAARVERFA